MTESIFDVIIVGAGPAGGMAARTIARKGFSVMVIEKKNEVGYPVHCGEGISNNALRNNDIKPSEKWIVKNVNGIKYTILKGCENRITFDEKGYCIDRRLFDQSLIQEAIDLGCNLQLSTKIKNIERKDGFIRVSSQDNAFSCRILIGADGARSCVAKWRGMNNEGRFLKGLQYKIKDTNLEEKDWLEFYSSYNFAVGGYAWKFPRGDGRFNIGVVTSSNPKKELENFFNYLGINTFSVIEKNSGIIRVSGPLNKLVYDGTIICGDAAGLTNPITKGGIHAALTSGRFAGEIAIKALEGENFSEKMLMQYQKSIYSTPFAEKVLLEGMDTMSTLSDNEWIILGNAIRQKSIIKKVLAFPLKRSSIGIFKKLIILKKSFNISKSYGW